MCIAASQALADVAKKHGFREDYIIPNMDQWEVFPLEATRVGLKAMEQGVARIKIEEKKLYKKAEKRIRYARNLTQNMMDSNFIKPRK